MNTRLLAIMRKEFIQIRRDPRTLAIMFLIPVFQLIMFGYAVTTDVKHLPMAVLDRDKSAASRELIDTYQASTYFDVAYNVGSESELAYLMDSGAARAGLIVPAGYGADLARRGSAQVSFAIDGSDPTVANTALAAAQTIGQAKSAEIVQAMLSRSGLNVSDMPGLDVRTRVWYNPDLASANYMIPALIGVILQVLTAMLTALAIVRERELGTIEQLIVTPLQPWELVVGKIVPYVLIAFFDTMEVLLIGTLWFKVPINGSVALLLSLAGLFLMSSLGIGLFISTVARTQQEAMLLAWFTMLPSIFLSGFMFPLAAMPAVLRALSYGIPLTYFLVIVRGIILKGVGLQVLLPQVVALAIFGVAIMSLSTLRFHKRLE
ncbi:MAG: ABC transporter permease [Chloroflexi bacterium]|nr:ABC transporter permease [Chloroflexota bacterium]